MTICAAGNRADEIHIVSDCRVTYDEELVNPFSDCLVKTVPLGDSGFMCFAGDILCIQAISKTIDIDRAMVRSRGGHEVLSRLARQLRNAYAKYAARRKAPHVEFLLGVAHPNGLWLGACTSPNFALSSSNTAGEAFAIGDSRRGREAAARAMSSALHSAFPAEQVSMVAASFIDGGLALLYPEKYGEKAAERHGVSSLFTVFRFNRNGLTSTPYTVDMFRGRIADRDEPRGYAAVSEVVFDPEAQKFMLVDHQSGQRNPLLELRNFRSQRFGIINTDFDPYKLKA